MPLPLDNLDDLTFADLVEEARSRIAAVDPEWTNHNPSDPGITLLELLAWRTEMLVYRTNQVPPPHTRAFLKLLNGPDWTPGVPEGSPREAEALADSARATVLGLRERFRAVTPEDYEYLSTTTFNQWRLGAAKAEAAAALRPCMEGDRYAREAASPAGPAGPPPATACPHCLAGADCPTLAAEPDLAEWWRLTALPARAACLPSRMGVARARCVPLRDLEQRRLERRTRTLPGHVSLIAVPSADGGTDGTPPAPGTGAALADALWAWLDERRTLTTHHHVLPPRYVGVRMRALVVLSRDTPDPVEAASAAGVPVLAALAPLLDADSRQKLQAQWSHLGADFDPRVTLVRVLRGFFDPVQGGREGTGWPFGRSVYLSEVYELLERQPSVEYVANVMVTSPERGARLLWNRDGEVYGLALGAETEDRQGAALQLLPRLDLSVDDVIACERTVPVEVVVDLPPLPAGTDDDVAAQVEGAIHLAIRGAFPPYGGAGAPDQGVPDGTAPQAAPVLRSALAALFVDPDEMRRGLERSRTVTEDDVRAALRDVPAEFAPVALTLRAEAERVGLDGRRRPLVRFRAREMAEVRVTLRRGEPTP